MTILEHSFDHVNAQDSQARKALGGPNPNKWEDAYISHMVSERARQAEHAELMSILERLVLAIEAK